MPADIIYTVEDHGEGAIIDGVPYHRIGTDSHIATVTPDAGDTLNLSTENKPSDLDCWGNCHNWTVCENAVSWLPENTDEDILCNPSTDIFTASADGELRIIVDDWMTALPYGLDVEVNGVWAFNLNSPYNTGQARLTPGDVVTVIAKNSKQCSMKYRWSPDSY